MNSVSLSVAQLWNFGQALHELVFWVVLRPPTGFEARSSGSRPAPAHLPFWLYNRGFLYHVLRQMLLPPLSSVSASGTLGINSVSICRLPIPSPALLSEQFCLECPVPPTTHSSTAWFTLKKQNRELLPPGSLC